jgi:hypothetical protein
MNTRIVVMALVMASAGPASAQWAVDASIGATVPVGQGEGRTTGLDLMGAVDWHPVPKLPLAFRAEVGWDRIGFAGSSQVAEYVTRIAFDVIVDPPLPGTRLRPYVLAGGGAYISASTAPIASTLGSTSERVSDIPSARSSHFSSSGTTSTTCRPATRSFRSSLGCAFRFPDRAMPERMTDRRLRWLGPSRGSVSAHASRLSP